MPNLCTQVSREEFTKIIQESGSLREAAEKLGYASQNSCLNIIKDYAKKYGVSVDHFGRSNLKVKWTPKAIFAKGSKPSSKTLRKYYYDGNYTEYKCSICGQEAVWQGKPLVLTLDHISGDHSDNRLENLRWVCPNCDRQLPTFGVKNPFYRKHCEERERKYCIDCGKQLVDLSQIRCPACYEKYCESHGIPSAVELESFLKQYEGDFQQAANYYEVHYMTIRRWCRQYGLSLRAQDYQPVSTTDSNSMQPTKTKKRGKSWGHAPQPVAQIDTTTNEIIKIFPSVLSTEQYFAADDYPFNYSCVLRVCHHQKRHKTYKGFKWAFVSELEETNPDLLKKYYEKDQISLDN